MEDGHNYTFFMTGEAYRDGYDRIFRKGKRDESRTKNDKARPVKAGSRKRKSDTAGSTQSREDEERQRPSKRRRGSPKLQVSQRDQGEKTG